MALVVYDRVQETGTANTTVSFTLSGSVSGFQSFAVIGNGNTTYYVGTDASGNWEVGLGTYSTTGPTLTRTTILSSSNSNAAVTFSGTCNIFVSYPAGKSVNLNASGNVTALGTVTSGTWNGSTIPVLYGGTGVTVSSGASSVVLRDANQNISINRLNQQTTTVTAAAGTTILTAASTFGWVLNGTGGQTFKLPDATSLTDTTAFEFNNNATGTLTIVNNASGAIGTIAPGGAAGIALLDNTTVAGLWDVHAFIPENVQWGTNTLALGGTVISGGTWQGGTIQSGYGGTGLTTFTAANNALYSTSASALAAGTLPTAAGGTGLTTFTAANNAIYSSSASALTAGTLPAAAGGTGATTFTSNGVIYGSGTSALGVTAAGTTGQILVATTSGAPSWGSLPSSAAVTSITFGSTGLTPATATTGVVSVAGTLIAVNGGTGQSTYAVGDLLQGAATNTLAKLAAVATGSALISGGVTTANSWGKIGLTTHVSGTLAVTNGGTGVTTSTGTGAVVLGTNPTIAITGAALTLQDATDATKTANFVLSGLTTATNFTYTLPAVTGVALASLGNISQTFLGETTFAPTTASSTLILGSTAGTGTLTLGRSTTTQTTNIQAGATAASNTKTINIGTGGLVSSTTAITIGSSQAGTSTTTLNGVTLIPIGATINTPSGATIDLQVNSVTQLSIGASGTGFSSTILTTVGSASMAPFSFYATGNTLLTVPVEGTMEYLDGENYYVTPNIANGRAFVVANNYRRLIANGTAIVGTIANFFGGTSNISLVSGDYYEIEIYMLAARGSSAGTATITLTNSVAPTLMLVDYEQSPLAGISTPPGSVTALTNLYFRGTTTTTSAAYSFTTGSLAASVTHFFKFKIWLRNSTGTSLKIQMTAGATNNSMTPQAGSYYLVRTLPNGNTGTFAA